MEKELFLVFSAFSLFSLYWLYLLPGVEARLGIVFMFLAPAAWTISCILRGRHDLARVAGAVSMFLAPAFVFFVRNMNRLSPFLEGIELSETTMLIQKYDKAGLLQFSGPHSYFPQTPYLAYAVEKIGGMSVVSATIVMMVLDVIFVGSVGLLALKVIGDCANTKTSYVPYLAVFSLISSRSLMWTTLPYRYIGSWIFPLMILIIYSKGKARPTRTLVIALLLLVIGATLGDPLSAFATSLLFIAYTILRRRISYTVLALVPIAYVMFAGMSYVFYLRAYSLYAWDGLHQFLDELLVGNLAERVLPWGRMALTSTEDAYVSSITYLSLLMLALIVALCHVRSSWLKPKSEAEGCEENRTLLRAATVCLLFALLVASATYIGISVEREVTFSDARTNVMLFVLAYLVISFPSRTLFSKIRSKRFLGVLIVLLLAVSSARVVYETYPKSVHDPVLAVEDMRLNTRADEYAGKFIASTYRQGNVFCDYKTCILSDLQTSIIHRPFRERILSQPVPNLGFSDFLIFDLQGLNYKSIFIPPEVYAKAHEMGVKGNLIYHSGAAVVVTGPFLATG